MSNLEEKMGKRFCLHMHSHVTIKSTCTHTTHPSAYLREMVANGVLEMWIMVLMILTGTKLACV